MENSLAGVSTVLISRDHFLSTFTLSESLFQSFDFIFSSFSRACARPRQRAGNIHLYLGKALCYLNCDAVSLRLAAYLLNRHSVFLLLVPFHASEGRPPLTDANSHPSYTCSASPLPLSSVRRKYVRSTFYLSECTTTLNTLLTCALSLLCPA